MTGRGGGVSSCAILCAQAEEKAYKHHAALLYLPDLLQPFRFSCLSSFVQNAVTVTVIEGRGGGGGGVAVLDCILEQVGHLGLKTWV